MSEPGSFANDVVEDMVDKIIDEEKEAANLGFKTQESLGNVGKELKDGVVELVDNFKTIVNKEPKP